MAGIAQNGQKCLIFIVVPPLRLENIKERWKKTERYIQSVKNIYMSYNGLVLEIVTVRYSFH